LRHILIATANRGKLREIQAIFADFPAQWVTLADLPSLPECVEDGATFAANARKKALHYAAASGLWTLADDSGLVVDALDGAPGVRSARYSPSGRDADNNARLIAELAGVPEARRSARFVCCVALAAPGGVLATARGTIAGRIIDKPRGTNGFGYDPHFWVPELGATTAELPPEHKNRISHRGNALRALLPKLRALLAEEPE